MQLADRLVRCEVGGECCVHNLLSARDSSWQGHEAHPADHGVEGEELLNLWLVTQDGIAMGFRCRNDEIFVWFPRRDISRASCPALTWARWLSQVVRPAVRPPTTDPESAA